MRRIISFIMAVLLSGLCLAADTIEKIVIEGNKKVSRDTIMFYLKSSESGLYSPDRLRDDFNTLWNTGFFEDIKIETADGEKGKIVTFIVKENKLIKSVVYKTSKKIKENDITEKLRENNISLLAFSYYSPAKMKRVERIVRNMMLDKGYNDGKVNIITKEVNDQIELTVEVTHGPRTKIGAIIFPGIGKAVSSGFLRGGMKNNKVHGILSAIGGKDVYNREKIAEDLEEIKVRLQQKGYLEAKVGAPEFATFRKHTWYGSVQNMLRITIPVELGPQYRLGEVKIEGNKIYKTEYLNSLVRMKKDKVFNIKKRNKSIEDIQKAYYSLGHIYCQALPLENLDPVKKVADLTLRINEGEVAYLGKLQFKGNTYTKDNVIRREWFLVEGGRLNLNALEGCITRMKQLGLVSVDKMPDIKPNPQDPSQVDILVDVKEINRQMINFNVGYSGFDGWFIALGYSTQNFMGAGESFGINLQSGTRSKNYSISFTEPYLFNLPASLGLNVHKSELRYPYLYTRKGQGFGLSTSWRFMRYWGASVGYSYEDIEITDVNKDLDFDNNPYYDLYYSARKHQISALSPVLYYSTVDSPIFPSRGSKYLLSYRYSGGFLGGDIEMHKVKASFTQFIPLWKNKHTIGIQVAYEFLDGFGNTSGDAKHPIPIYEKFFLGGEQSVRGYDIYRIGPRNSSGAVIGGTKSFYTNLEYIIPLNEQLSFALFFDAGNAFDYGRKLNFHNLYTSMGGEIKIFVPMLNVPFRLIFAYNPRLLQPGDQHFVFRFAVGASFQ